MYKMVSSGMPASVALEVTSWAKERDGPRNGSEFLGVSQRHCRGHTLSRRLAVPRSRRELRSSMGLRTIPLWPGCAADDQNMFLH